MFITIDTNGATKIAIHVPHEGAEKSLPALAAMFEQNATFLATGWSSAEIKKPSIAITLGDQFEIPNNEQPIVIAASGAVLRDELVPATNEVFTSNAAALKKRDEELSKLRTELSFVKQERDDLKAHIEELSANVAAEA